MNNSVLFHKNIYRNIENELKIQEINKSEFAKKLGKSKANVSYTLSKLKKGKTINTTTLKKWAEVLNVPIEKFFKQHIN